MTMAVARFGARYVNQHVLHGITWTLGGLQRAAMGGLRCIIANACLSSASLIKKMLQLSPAEAADYTQQDLVDVGRVFSMMQREAAAAEALEMNVACDMNWHTDISSELRDQLRGLPSNTNTNNKNGGRDSDEEQGGSEFSGEFSEALSSSNGVDDCQGCRIAIFAASNDKLVPLAAAEWLAAFYGSKLARLEILEGRSHGGSITGGGPMSKPGTYERIIRGVWGL